MARSRSLGAKALQHVAKFGTLVDLSSTFGRALIVPSANAAVASKPPHEAFTPAGRRMRLQFGCIDNTDAPNIFCDQDDDFHYVIINKSLVHHLFNIARQIMCMRDVFTSIGNPKLERRRRKTYNRRFTEFGLDLRWNYYETNTNTEFKGVSPNEEPLCPIRGHAYWILYWFMLESLVTHELSHVLQGHLDFLKQGWVLDIKSADKHLRVRAFLEMLADILAVEWFTATDLQGYQKHYPTLFNHLSPDVILSLRINAAPLAFWSFCSFDDSFSMDIRNHGTAVTGHTEGDQEIMTHLQKNLRIDVVEELSLSGAEQANIAGAKKAIATSKRVMQQCRKNLRFYQPLELFNTLYRNIISDDIAESAADIDEWFKIIPQFSFLEDRFRKRQFQYLKDWLTRSPGFRNGEDTSDEPEAQ